MMYVMFFLLGMVAGFIVDMLTDIFFDRRDR
jgi:hypothetical protein